MCIPVYNLEFYEYFRRLFVVVYVVVLLDLQRLYFSCEILQEDLLA